MEECIFCQIVNGKRNAKKVYENDKFLAILDMNPETNGHTIILSKEHFETIFDLPSDFGEEMVNAIQSVSLDLIKKGYADGFNVAINTYKVAQQTIPHFHLHILPIKKGSGMKLKMVNGIRDKKLEEQNGK